MKFWFAAFLIVLTTQVRAQSPGLIVRPAGGNGTTVLNPNGDAYSSSGSTGFVSDDIPESEIAYKVVPPAITEPTGDVATGPSGGFTDIVKTVDGSGFYISSDGTNLLMRLRIGSIISGSKGYSVLVDTDGKIGNSGSGADPNFVAATNTSNGNPGFEYEIVLQTNFQVAVYNVDGNSNPGSPVSTYSLQTNSQISAALSTDGNNADYFYDWYVPLAAIGSPASMRLAATTVTSPSSALQGSRSDIYGIDDANGTPSDLWTSVVNAQPILTVASLSAPGNSTSPVCTAAPILNTPVNIGANVAVTGSWTRMDVSKPSTTTITLYQNGVAVNTTTVNSGNTWSITVPTIATNDVFYAKAQSTGESQCLQSNSVMAGCTSIPTAPIISCASSKGITGTIPLGATINIYQVTTSNQSPTTTPLTTGLIYTNNASDRTFNYYGTNSQTGNACQGQNGILATNSTYMFVTNNGGCLSAPVFICITGSSQNSWNYITTNAISLTTPIYPFNNGVSGSGSTTGQLLRLFVNNQYVSSVTATGSTFSFTGLSLNAGDQLRVYAQTTGACMTVSPSFIVSCYTAAPVITTNSAGNLLVNATAIGGQSAYPGATVNLYRGTSPSGTLVGSSTVNGSGNWNVSGLTLVAGETYYATQTNSGCNSASSLAAIVAGVTNVCPAFSSTTFSEGAATVGGTISSFTGTVRVYLDGTMIGSAALTNATTWSVLVNTTYVNALYPNGVLTVTAQSSGNAESASCASSATVTCSAPLTPALSPTSATINTGQSVTYSLSNVLPGAWYSITNNSGASFARSQYASNASDLTITTSPFNTAGTYQLNISADKLTGCSKSTTLATVVVNNLTMPVHFINVDAKRVNNGVEIVWNTDQEQDILNYTVEVSGNGVDFNDAGMVAPAINSSGPHQYLFGYVTSEIMALFFRIKETDHDGRYLHSKIVAVAEMQAKWCQVFPNPSNGSFILKQQSDVEQLNNVTIQSAEGQIIFKGVFRLNRGVNQQWIHLAGVAPGVYFIRSSTKTGNVNLKLRVF